jgi:chemotaxis phosphatase, CheZ
MGAHDVVSTAVLPVPVPVTAVCESDDMLVRVGQITRTLHDSLRELGLDKALEKATHEIPDVRDRLDYVARMTEQAAQRVLNATDAAIPLQERIDSGAAELLGGWRAALDAPFPKPRIAIWRRSRCNA